MTADLVRFVDSIAASPTVRLDINDEVKWSVNSFAAPPPRLRRAVSQNAMRDGVFVSSSLYDARVLTIGLDLITTGGSAQDDNATELQKLARELDRADNFLMYQPTGASKPVFFRLYRSDMSQVENITGSKAFRKPTIELLAEPFALGLRETLGPFTVNNDPAAGSNPCGIDAATLGTILGDVAAPAIITDLSARRSKGILAVGSGLSIYQAESITLGTDTTNPGGGPDAAMSGTGTNNYVRTSFAGTATMATRVSNGSISKLPARIFAIVRRSDATSDMTARFQFTDNLNTYSLSAVTIPKSTSRQVLDLGYVGDPALGMRLPRQPDFGDYTFNVQAARSSGTGTLDWDAILFVSGATIAQWSTGAGDLTSDDLVFDGVDAMSYGIASGGNIFANGGARMRGHVPLSGGLPCLPPGSGATTNNLVYIVSGATTHDKTTTTSLQVDYYPQYMFVRPNLT